MNLAVHGLEGDIQQAHWLTDMRTFASVWPDREIVQRTVAQFPWRSNADFQNTYRHIVDYWRWFDLPKSQMDDGDVPVLGSQCVIGFHNEAKVKPPGVVTGRSGTLGLLPRLMNGEITI